MKKIDVLIIDDSALVRQTLQEILRSDPEIGRIETAQDPYVAAEKLQEFVPDVITLDIEMPKMDGLTFLKKLMSQHPLPVVICSSIAGHNTEEGIRALEYGAIDIIEKPKMGLKIFFEESKILILDTVKAAARANVKKLKLTPTAKPVEPKLSADVVEPPKISKMQLQTTEKVVLVGASTGGTEALRIFLERFPVDCPGIVIVQHMPENFTRSFAERLNNLCAITVKEAENGDNVLPGRALIAQGNKHLLIKVSGARYFVEVKDGPLVSRHRPSVDVLFRSGANYVGKNAIAAILTGMGDDGAKGMLELKQAGAYTIAQDEESCVVFGMPKEAIKLGGVMKVLPLEAIPYHIMEIAKKGKW
ncbi:MAG: chemotaxis response regulator protein-glutamate methylesterase [Calditerrivibrio sp.]|nr:chemotaxis response regulator protein-glutamate methylesterase [Calditerrivibrio sp.]